MLDAIDEAVFMDQEQLQALFAGRFEIGEYLGEGSMSRVFRARSADGHDVALKLLNDDSSTSATEQARFRQEIDALQQLRHPSVLIVQSTGVVGGHTYLATQYIAGRSLSRVLREYRTLSTGQAVAVAQSIADGLAHAHGRGVIHRDIKPSNVRLPDSGTPPAMLLDFGVLGRLLDRSGTTRAGQIFGTPRYMAPEQFRGEPQGPETDVYGVGMLLYEMIYGRPPFEQNTLLELAAAVLTQAVQLSPAVTLPHELRSLLLACVAKSRSDRPKNGAELATRLRALGFAPVPPILATLGAPALEAANTTQDKDTLDITWPVEKGPPIDALQPPPAARSGPRATVPPSSAGTETSAPDLDHTWPVSRTDAAASNAAASADTVAALGKRSASGSRTWIWWPIAAALALVVLGVGWLYLGVGRGLISPGSGPAPPLDASLALGVMLGVGLMGLGVAGAWGVARLAEQTSPTGYGASQYLLGLGQRERLTHTIAIEMDELIRRCRTVDERLLGSTIALMMNEYSGADSSSDRRAALLAVVEMLKKLEHRLSPWYVRHQRPIQYLAGLVGLVAGVVQIAQSFQ